MKRYACVAGLLLALLAGPAGAAGEFQWNKHIGGEALGDVVIVNAIATDGSGNVIAVGQMEGTAAFGSGCKIEYVTSAGTRDIFLAKYSATGLFLWVKRIGSTGSDIAFGVAVNQATGDIYVTGQFAATVDFGGGGLTAAGGTSVDIFLAKYNSSGGFVWAKRFGSSGLDSGYAVAVSQSSGNVTMTGEFGNFGPAVDFGGGVLTSAGAADIFIAQYDSAGNYVWASRFGSTGSDRGAAISIDSSGIIGAAGSFVGNVDFGGGTLTSNGYPGSTATDIYVLRLTSAGAFSWARRFGGTSDDKAWGVAIGPSGEVVSVGDWNGTADFGGGPVTSLSGSNMFVVKYTSANAYVWYHTYGADGVPTPSDIAKAVAVDASGNVVFTGLENNPIDFGGGNLCPSCSSQDAFIVKLNSAGAHVWSGRYGALYDETGLAITTDASGNVLVGGQFYRGIDFGGGQMSSNGGYDGFIVKKAP